MSKLGRDAANIPIQGFAPTRIVTVTTAEWTPNKDDRAFRVNTETDYQINATGTSGTLLAGIATVIVKNQTYKFATGQNIEVMGA